MVISVCHLISQLYQLFISMVHDSSLTRHPCYPCSSHPTRSTFSESLPSGSPSAALSSRTCWWAELQDRDLIDSVLWLMTSTLCVYITYLYILNDPFNTYRF
jgi:hypothetical protein